jgi:hypothetical protein
MWIRAYDYFESLVGPPFRIPEDIRQLETIVHDHLLWRFRTLFSFPQFFYLCVLSLLDEIIAQCELVLVSGQRSSSVISGHDVTVLPLALALILASDRGTLSDGAAVAYDVDTALAQLRWPRYSAVLVMELRVRKGIPLLCWKLRNDKLLHEPCLSSSGNTVPDLNIAAQAISTDEIKGQVDFQQLKHFIEKVRLKQKLFPSV